MQSEVDSLNKVQKLERSIKKELPCYDLEQLTAHTFCEGMYARELFIPAGAVIVGKMHAKENFFLLAMGELSMLTSDGIKVIRGPHLAVTKPGDKRVAYANTDAICYNFHLNDDDERDMQVLEQRYIVPAELELEWAGNPALLESGLKALEEKA